MRELEKVCKELLDNADLDVELKQETSTIRLRFATGNKKGELVEVFFECNEFHLFRVIKASEDSEGFFVGQTIVNKIEEPKEVKNLLSSQGWRFDDRHFPKILYHIKVFGCIEIEIICLKFDWHLTLHQDN